VDTVNAYFDVSRYGNVPVLAGRDVVAPPRT
jgi:hypothetical protein